MLQTTKTNEYSPKLTKTSAALRSIVIFLHTACASRTGANELTEVKQELNSQLYKECIVDSEKLGYPTTVSGFAILKQFGIYLNLTPFEYCRRTVRHIIRRSFTAPHIAATETQSARWPNGKI